LIARGLTSFISRTRRRLGPWFGVRRTHVRPGDPIRSQDPLRRSALPEPPLHADTGDTGRAKEESALTRALELRLADRSRRLANEYRQHAQAADALDLLTDVRRNGAQKIRQPPRAAQAVLAVVRRRHYSLSQVTRLVEQDPALAQMLLRHANSAWYATPGAESVAGIGPAVQRIGTSGVHSAVIASTIAGELLRPGAGFDAMAKQVWDHMVRVGPLAADLAEAFSLDADLAFTLGLTHDAGKLVLFDRIGQLRRRRRRELRFPSDFVSKVLEKLHGPLGGLAALAWGLGPNFARAISEHHRLGIIEVDDPMSQVIFLAERLDLSVTNGSSLDLGEVWSRGRLTGSVERAETAVDELTRV
jgi:HD-like signal output (HDOD) protein